MVQHTTRDYVWHYACVVAEETDAGSVWSSTWGATDVLDRLDADADDLDRLDRIPSRRLVRDVLGTMADLGEIERARTQGQYEAFEEGPEPAQADADRARQRGETSEGVTSSGGQWVRTPTRDEQESDETASTTAADPTEEFDPDADADALLDDADGAADASEPASDGDQDLDALVADLDVPGADHQAGDRRAAIRAVLDYLRDGPATQSLLLDDVYPDHPAGYGSSRGWWEHLVLPALRDLADQSDALTQPDAPNPWRIEGSA